MPITFPRDLPTARFKACRFQLGYMQTRAPTRGGLTQVASLGPDLWSLRFETTLLGEAEASEVESWLASLRGGARLFRAWHPLRRWARAYPTGYGGLTVSGNPWAGTATLTAVATELDTVTLGALPVGFVLGLGDFLAFSYASGSRALHRVVEAGTASAGGTVTVGVEPIVRPGWPSGGTVTLEKAACDAVLDASSVDIRWQPGRKAAIAWGGSQVI